MAEITEDDGLVFDPASISVSEIRGGARYGGLRARLTGRLGNARCSLQVDVGYGDAVVPGPQEVVFPALLEDLPAPRLLGYPPSAVVAEKLEAIVHLGMANSRMKDYFDLRVLIRKGDLSVPVVGEAIAATFSRRGTPLPARAPLGLTPEFATDSTKRAQWRAFLSRTGLLAPSLEDVVEEIRAFFLEPLRLAREEVRTGRSREDRPRDDEHRPSEGEPPR